MDKGCPFCGAPKISDDVFECGTGTETGSPVRCQSKSEFDTLRAKLAAAEREIARLREGVECHVARPGEGTYECRLDAPCPACRLRDAERERDHDRDDLAAARAETRIAEDLFNGACVVRDRIRTERDTARQQLAAEKERAERAEACIQDRILAFEAAIEDMGEKMTREEQAFLRCQITACREALGQDDE